MDTIAPQNEAKLARSSKWTSYTLLGLIALALLTGFWLIFGTVEGERSEREQVRMTNRILLELRNINRAALRAETGQRGYLITLDRSYLDPYHAGSAEMRPAISNLRRLLDPVATPRQAALVDEIERHAETKRDDFSRSVKLLEQGKLLDARRLVLTDEGQQAMIDLRNAISEMEEIEQRILVQAIDGSARAEARTIPMLGVLLFLVLAFIVFSVRLASRAARAEAEAAQANALAEAHDRADLLARELNHRVKNLFAVILAIVQMSGRDTPEAKPVVESIGRRIRALLTAHEVTQGALDRPVASLRALVETTLSPYQSESQPAEIQGEELLLPEKSVTPLGLVLHELTTNAVKYGAWAHGGTVSVSWLDTGQDIQIDWREAGSDNIETPTREGFGSLLMTSAARQLGGTIDRSFSADGCHVAIKFPRSQTVETA